jgi:hypothetical protein
MNSNIIKEDMTLDEKLAAIDAAIANAKTSRETKASFDKVQGPIDPSDLLMCEGCQ